MVNFFVMEDGGIPLVTPDPSQRELLAPALSMCSATSWCFSNSRASASAVAARRSIPGQRIPDKEAVIDMAGYTDLERHIVHMMREESPNRDRGK